MNEETLATEMLKELKSNAKRKDIIIILLIACLLITNIIWICVESQYETIAEEEQYIEDIVNSTNSSYTQTIK